MVPVKKPSSLPKRPLAERLPSTVIVLEPSDSLTLAEETLHERDSLGSKAVRTRVIMAARFMFCQR